MAYTKVFEKPYPQWHEKPIEDTPVRASTFEEYDSTFQHIEDHLDGSIAVKPVTKTNAMTQAVGVDETGKLFTVPGGSGSSSADDVSYDNTESGLFATNVQMAIDELANNSGGTATTTTYDNTTSGLSSDNVQGALDELKVISTSIQPIAKTSAMTQAVGKDSNGQLWTEPGGGGGNTFTDLTVGSRKESTQTGTSSVVEGYVNEASGENSHAEGYQTKVISKQGHAEGYQTEVGKLDTTWGDIVGNNSHAEGYQTKAYGNSSHAEGYGSQTNIGYNAAHAEGLNTTATGTASHAEGSYTWAKGDNSHASGYYTVANSNNQFVCGKFNNNKSTNLFEIGKGSATSDRSNALEVDTDGNLNVSGTVTDGNGKSIPSPVSKTTAMTQSVGIDSNGQLWTEPGGSSGTSANNVTYNNTSSGMTATDVQAAIDELANSGGSGNYVSKAGDTMSGTLTVPDVTIGSRNTSQSVGRNSFTVGNHNVASGNYSHAEGTECKATGLYSHAEGSYCTASGTSSYAGGSHSTASGYESFVVGYYNTAEYDDQFICGYYNDNQADTILEVGNGVLDEDIGEYVRSNAFEVYKNGNIKLTGEIDTAEVSTLSNSDYIYVSVGGKIKKITIANLKTVLGI